MGVWGAGLYSGDLAMDLRSTIGAVVRLPFDADRLVEILCGTQRTAANDPGDEEHTTFWLVVADQFAKRGIACDRVRTKALAIIDRGEDIALLEKLGMVPKDLRKRKSMLAELRARIAVSPAKSAARKVLQSPQPLIMQTGDALVYPVCNGNNINPYLASKEKNIRFTKDGKGPWLQNGWGAMAILDCGRAFDFLSWYRAAILAETRAEKPALDSLRGAMLWNLPPPGTCSAGFFRKLELEKIGVLPVDREKADAVFPKRLRSEVAKALQDISIAGSMKSVAAGSAVPNPGWAHKGRWPTISAIDEVIIEDD